MNKYLNMGVLLAIALLLLLAMQSLYQYNTDTTIIEDEEICNYLGYEYYHYNHLGNEYCYNEPENKIRLYREDKSLIKDYLEKKKMEKIK